MNAEEFREYCLSRKAATEDAPFGEETLVFRMRKKIFALLSLERVPPQANLKCEPDRALELRDRYEQIIPGYHMNKRHWNTVILDGALPDRLVRELIDHSYSLVAAKASPRRS